MDTLSNDGVAVLLQDVDIPTLLKLRSTCRRIHDLSRAKEVWIQQFYRQITSQSILFAPYWKDPDSLDASQLERLVLHLLRLDTKLQSGDTTPSIAVPLHRRRSVTWVRLIQSQWLLVASSDDISSTIALWSTQALLSGGSDSPLAEAFLSAPVTNGAVDVRGSSVTFALELHARTPQIEILSIVDIDGTICFCRRGTVHNTSHLRFICGAFVGVSVVDNINVPSIANWTDGSIEKLREKPDFEGGAIAMHPTDKWIAVVRRQVLEIYLTPSHGGTDKPILWRCLPLAHLVGAAVFATHLDHTFTPPLTSLRLCINCDNGIHVYRVFCDVELSLLSLGPLWHHNPEPNGPIRGKRLVTFSPSLGVTGDRVTWLWADGRAEDNVYTFAMKRITSDDCRTFEWFDMDMPVQAGFGVRDVDEARGIMVFGNAFGELVLYDFSGYSSEDFAGCHEHDLRASPHADEDILPTEPIVSTSIAPFPYNKTNSPAYYQEIFSFWKSHQNPVVPQGWSTDFEDEDNEWRELFAAHVRRMPSYTWRTEVCGHFYGRPIPLLRCLTSDEDTVIADIGGLLFLWERVESWDDGFYLVHPTMTVPEVVELVQKEEYYKAIALHPELVASEFMFICGLSRMWAWENKQLGRNRWRELADRGGRVLHPGWLIDWKSPDRS